MQRKLAIRNRASGWDALLPQVSPRVFGDGEASAADESQAQEHEEVDDSSSDSEEAMADEVRCITFSSWQPSSLCLMQPVTSPDMSVFRSFFPANAMT